MKTALRFILAIAAAIAFALLFRCVAFTIYTVPEEGVKPWLIGGDRVLVNRWSYGLRTGGGKFFGYSRWMKRKVGKGELVAFNFPLDTLRPITSRPVSVAFCTAGPGDTVRIDGKPIIPPCRCRMVKVEPWNIKLLCNTYRIHEGRKADIEGGRLLLDGKPTQYAYFSKSYYWMATMPGDTFPDSRIYGFVPEDHIIGRVVGVVYSKDKRLPLTDSFRSERWFMPL